MPSSLMLSRLSRVRLAATYAPSQADPRLADLFGFAARETANCEPLPFPVRTTTLGCLDDNEADRGRCRPLDLPPTAHLCVARARCRAWRTGPCAKIMPCASDAPFPRALLRPPTSRPDNFRQAPRIVSRGRQQEPHWRSESPHPFGNDEHAQVTRVGCTARPNRAQAMCVAYVYIQPRDSWWRPVWDSRHRPRGWLLTVCSAVQSSLARAAHERLAGTAARLRLAGGGEVAADGAYYDVHRCADFTLRAFFQPQAPHANASNAHITIEAGSGTGPGSG